MTDNCLVYKWHLNNRLNCLFSSADLKQQTKSVLLRYSHHLKSGLVRILNGQKGQFYKEKLNGSQNKSYKKGEKYHPALILDGPVFKWLVLQLQPQLKQDHLKTEPFEIPPSKSPDFKSLQILNDPHCIQIVHRSLVFRGSDVL